MLLCVHKGQTIMLSLKLYYILYNKFVFTITLRFHGFTHNVLIFLLKFSYHSVMENGISRLYPARIMGHMALEQATVLMVVLVTESRAIAQAFPSLKFVIPILHLMKVHDNICKFAKNGLVPSEIGVILRDSHGIAQVNSLTGSKILRILKSHGLATEMPEDLYHLIKKAVAIRKLYNVFTAVRAFRIVSPSESLLR